MIRQARALAQRLGYRSLAYLTFVAALVPVERIMDRGLVEPEDGGGLGLVLVLLVLVSAAFFLVNAALAVTAGARGRPIGTAAIGCSLPVICVAAAQIAISSL